MEISPIAAATAVSHRQRNIQRAMQETGTSQDEVPDQVLDVVGSGGMPLERSVQDLLEDRMDADFSDVRIHTGAKAAEAADAIDAKAFTCGNSIVFNSGEYDPESTEGQFLLAHELAHVEQQNGGAPLSMMPQQGADLEIDPDPQLERDADQAAKEALSGDEPLTVSRMGTDVHVQRLAEDEVFEAMALFEAELQDDTGLSEHRENHNQLQLSYLTEVATDVIAKQDAETSLDTKRELQDGSRGMQELANRYPSEADLKAEIEELTQSIDADLEDVALTDDQRQALDGNVDTNKWDDVAWNTVKGLLSVTSLGAFIAASETAAAAKDVDTDEIGTQAVARVRQGEISSWEDIKQIWQQTTGSLADRAEQTEREIRQSTWEGGEKTEEVDY